MTTRPQGSGQRPHSPPGASLARLRVMSRVSSPQTEVERGRMAVWASGRGELPAWGEAGSARSHFSLCRAVMEVLAQKCP